MSRGILQTRALLDEFCAEPLRRRGPILRLPRCPYGYAFLGSLAIHLGVVALLLCLKHQPASAPGELGSGAESLRLVATIQLGTIQVVASEAPTQSIHPPASVVEPRTPQAMPMPEPQPVAAPKPEPKPQPITASKPIEQSSEKGALQIASPQPQPSQVAAAVAANPGSRQENGTLQSGRPEGREDDTTASGGGTGKGVILAKPDYLHNPAPRYPNLARQHGWQGIAVFRMRVLTDGTADSVELIKTSGHSVLDKVSLETVRKWRFIPARAGDKTVSSWVEIPIRFQLVS